jgi:putative inorganic carbon (HCO3(-)) transporter
MPAIPFASHIPLSAQSWVHGAAMLLSLSVIVLTPNIRLLPEAWTGSLYNEKRILEVLVLCSYGLLLILSPAARTRWMAVLTDLPRKARTGFALVLGLALLSAILALRPEAALLEVVNVSLLFVLTIGIATWVQDRGPGAMRLFVYGLAAMALAYETRVLAGLLAILVEGAPPFPTHALFPGFVNLRFFNQIQTWTLPLLALPLWLTGRSPLWRSIAFTVLALWWMLLFIAAGRGTLLAVCGGAALTFAAFQKRSLPWLKIQALAAGLASLAYFALIQFAFSSQASLGEQALPQRLVHAFEDPARLRLLHDAWNLFLKGPIVGVGPMHYAHYFGDSSLHPHNSLLQLLSEWGLPATLLILALFLWGLSNWMKHMRNALRKREDHTTLVRVALLASIGGAALHSLVSGIIVMPLSQLLASCVIGLMLGDYLALRSCSASIHLKLDWRDRLLVAGLAASVLALGSLTTVTLFEAKDFSLRAAEQRAQTPFLQQPSPNPRFWLPGQLRSSIETVPGGLNFRGSQSISNRK